LRGATTTTTTKKKTLIYLDRSLELLSPSFPSLGSKKRFSSSFLARLGWTFVVAVDASSFDDFFPQQYKMKQALFFNTCVRVSCVALLSGPSSQSSLLFLLQFFCYNRREKGVTRTRNTNSTREIFLAKVCKTNEEMCHRNEFFLNQKIQKFSLFFCFTSF